MENFSKSPAGMKLKQVSILAGALFFLIQSGFAREKRSYKIFQFPANQIPRIDGHDRDWNIVPESYTVGMDQLWDDSGKPIKLTPKISM